MENADLRSICGGVCRNTELKMILNIVACVLNKFRVISSLVCFANLA
jgi:hypothetical protein